MCDVRVKTVRTHFSGRDYRGPSARGALTRSLRACPRARAPGTRQGAGDELQGRCSALDLPTLRATICWASPSDLFPAALALTSWAVESVGWVTSARAAA